MGPTVKRPFEYNVSPKSRRMAPAVRGPQIARQSPDRSVLNCPLTDRGMLMLKFWGGAQGADKRLEQPHAAAGLTP